MDGHSVYKHVDVPYYYLIRNKFSNL